MKKPDLDDIFQAEMLLDPIIHETPVLSSKSINEITGANIHFKCENFQKTGSFKFRGATHAVLKLKERLGDQLVAVATHSSGNHAAALSLAAANQNIKAHIVMPRDAPEIKKIAVRQYRGQITFCEPTLAARELALLDIIEKTSAQEIHPYNNFDVICGQGTAGLEMMEQCGSLNFVMAPVGGGGLLSGMAIVAQSLYPYVQIIGAEPQLVSDAKVSLETGILQPPLNKPTLADGLRTALCPLTFEILQQNRVQILTCTEEAIVEAMRLIWERMKIVVEPSSAVPLAVILENKALFKQARIGIILSGGNVDLGHLPFS